MFELMVYLLMSTVISYQEVCGKLVGDSEQFSGNVVLRITVLMSDVEHCVEELLDTHLHVSCLQDRD